LQLELNSQLDETEKNQAGLVEVPDSDEYEDDDVVETVEEDHVKSIIEERDLKEEAIWRNNRKSELKAIFENAMERDKIRKDSERPILLIQRALNNLKAVPLDPQKLKDPEIDNALGEIINAINSLRKITRKFRDKKN